MNLMLEVTAMRWTVQLGPIRSTIVWGPEETVLSTAGEFRASDVLDDDEDGDWFVFSSNDSYVPFLGAVRAMSWEAAYEVATDRWADQVPDPETAQLHPAMLTAVEVAP